MKQNVLLVVLVVAVAALTVVVVRQREEIVNLKLPAAVTMTTRAVPVERPAVAPAKEEAEPPVEPAPPPTSKPAPAMANSGAGSNFMSGLAGMMKSPQMKEMVRAQKKVSLDRMFGSLFK